MMLSNLTTLNRLGSLSTETLGLAGRILCAHADPVDEWKRKKIAHQRRINRLLAHMEPQERQRFLNELEFKRPSRNSLIVNPSGLGIWTSLAMSLVPRSRNMASVAPW